MKREKAIKYLEEKGKIKERTFNKKEEKEIETVMKQGKIYGDPIAEIQW